VSGDGFLTHQGNDKKQGTGGLLLRMLLRWFFYRQKEKSAQIFGGIKFYTYFCTLIMKRIMEAIKNLWFEGNRIYVKTTEGRLLSRPLEAYPELQEASAEQRSDYSLEDEGMAIRWEAIDVDMHISSFYETSEPNTENEVAAMFHRFPWLNVSEVARYLNINKSLLARYIYGISKPGASRLQEIREAFHYFGRELQSA
jgi:hypothetical protein